jgi:hypothetical protein
MKLSSGIKPISYIKSHAAEIIRQFDEHDEPLLITQNEWRSQGCYAKHCQLRGNPRVHGAAELRPAGCDEAQHNPSASHSNTPCLAHFIE